MKNNRFASYTNTAYRHDKLDLSIIDKFMEKLRIGEIGLSEAASFDDKLGKMLYSYDNMNVESIADYDSHMTYIRSYYKAMNKTIDYTEIRHCRAVIIKIMSHAISGLERPPVVDDDIIIEIEDSLIDRSFPKHVHDTIVREGLLSYYDRVRLGIVADTEASTD